MYATNKGIGMTDREKEIYLKSGLIISRAILETFIVKRALKRFGIKAGYFDITSVAVIFSYFVRNGTSSAISVRNDLEELYRLTHDQK